MQIICPKCNTIFIVSDKNFNLQARKVKCSKCSHIWFNNQSSDLSNQQNQPKLDHYATNSDHNKVTKKQSKLVNFLKYYIKQNIVS